MPSGRYVVEPAGAVLGWGMFTGAEGDDPTFIGFFARKQNAEALCALRDPDDPECHFYCDPIVEPAIVTTEGIFVANDYEIRTPEQLRDVWLSEQVDPQSLGRVDVLERPGVRTEREHLVEVVPVPAADFAALLELAQLGHAELDDDQDLSEAGELLARVEKLKDDLPW